VAARCSTRRRHWRRVNPAADEGGRNRWIENLFLFSVSLRRRWESPSPAKAQKYARQLVLVFFFLVHGSVCSWFRLLLCFVVLCWLQARPCRTTSVEEELEEAGASARGTARHCWLKKAGSSGGWGRDGVCGRCCGWRYGRCWWLYGCCFSVVVGSRPRKKGAAAGLLLVMEKLGLLPATVGEKKIKREGLCVVARKRKRRWGTVWRLSGEDEIGRGWRFTSRILSKGKQNVGAVGLKIEGMAEREEEESTEREGGAAPLKKMGLGLGFFFLYFSYVSKLPPLFMCVEDQYL